MAAVGPRGRLVRLAGITIIFLVLLVGIELTAHGLSWARDYLGHIPAVARIVNRHLDLNPYQRPSPDHAGHWLLVPGYGASGTEVIAGKLARGRTEGAAAFAAAGPGDLSINASGYKGPPLDETHGRYRILVLGDSVTFGYTHFDYVRILENTLTKRGIPAECINAGVEGYATKNILYRMEEFRALAPDMVVVLVGWNDLWAMEPSSFHWWGSLASMRLFDKTANIVRMFSHSSREWAELQRNKQKTDWDDPEEIRRLTAAPPKLIRQIKSIGEAFPPSTQVVLETLPGLYVSGAPPSQKALSIGHLPEYTNNPRSFAALTDSVNAAIRTLASEQGWILADTAEWSKSAFVPRDDFFVDSVHLTVEGYGLLGHWLAGMLDPHIRTGDQLDR